jgi:hypothetical protein
MSKKLLRIIVTLFLCSGCFSFGQTKNQLDVFSDVPMETREKLKERLQTLSNFQKDKDYENLYPLLEENKNDSKDFFIERQQSVDKIGGSRLIKFIPQDVYLLSPSDLWMIRGCGEYVKNGKKSYLESVVEAIYENDNWFFSSLIRENTAFGLKTRKCKMPKAEK